MPAVALTWLILLNCYLRHFFFKKKVVTTVTFAGKVAGIEGKSSSNAYSIGLFYDGRTYWIPTR